MTRMTRRQAVLGMGALVGSGLLLTSCRPDKFIQRVPGEQFPVWKKQGLQWWTTRQKEREQQRNKERQLGKRPDVKMPYPYLECGRLSSSRGYLGVQVNQLDLDEWGEVAFVVRNLGNAPSENCVTEIYEGPLVPYHIPFVQMTLTDRKIVCVQPWETKEVLLRWRRIREIGSIGIRCYDPLLDPGPLVFEQYDRHDSGISWTTP